MRAAFDQEGQDTARTPLLITAAVPAGKEDIDNGYEIDKVSRYSDWHIQNQLSDSQIF